MTQENFLWHKVSEQEKEEIKKNAKKLMDDFSKKLDKIKTSESHFSVGDGSRAQGEAWKTDSDFRDTFFSNAPFADGDFLVAEKGAWKK